MMKKKICACKRFLSLTISDFNLFLWENCNPPEKVTPSFPATPHLKAEVKPSPPPFFENLVGGSTSQQKKGGLHTMLISHKHTHIDIHKHTQIHTQGTQHIQSAS